MTNWTKVFEIGAPKTGTTSLGAAFRLLRLKEAGWNSELHDQLSKSICDSLMLPTTNENIESLNHIIQDVNIAKLDGVLQKQWESGDLSPLISSRP